MIYFERVIKGLSIALDAVGGEHTAVAKDLREPIKDLLHFVRLHQLDHEWREKYRAELTEVQQAGAEVDFDVFRQPFGKIFGDGHVGRLGKFTGLVDFGHSDAIGAFTFLLSYAADAFDAFAFAGFVFDFDAVIPFFPPFVAVHEYSSFLFG